MGKFASIYPSDYVTQLRSLTVPGYAGYPGGVVALTRYVSANTLFGGANRANHLALALQKVASGGEAARLRSDSVGRVFSGQGMPDDIVFVLGLVNSYHDALAKDPVLAPYMKQQDFLQALCDDSFLGMDCIGFVGTYLAVSGVDPKYLGGRPLDFAGRFPPVQSLAAVDALSVLMLTNGMHIQIIDEVIERSDSKLVVDICQASSMKDHDESKGPQCNTRVSLTAGGGDFLPVEQFRAAKDGKTKWADYAASLAPNEKPSDNGYEMYLRKTMTQKNYHALGYQHGAIFQLSGGGDPANPVAGSVYIGTMAGLAGPVHRS